MGVRDAQLRGRTGGGDERRSLVAAVHHALGPLFLLTWRRQVVSGAARGNTVCGRREGFELLMRQRCCGRVAVAAAAAVGYACADGQGLCQWGIGDNAEQPEDGQWMGC